MFLSSINWCLILKFKNSSCWWSNQGLSNGPSLQPIWLNDLIQSLLILLSPDCGQGLLKASKFCRKMQNFIFCDNHRWVISRTTTFSLTSRWQPVWILLSCSSLRQCKYVSCFRLKIFKGYSACQQCVNNLNIEKCTGMRICFQVFILSNYF
jgi:hypothetical protein